MAGSKDNGAGTRREDRLTVAHIRAARPGDELQDGGGLIGVGADRGGVRWVYRFTSPVSGRRREMGLGFRMLADARRERDRLREQVRAGADPLLQAEQAADAERQAEAARKREAERNASTLRVCAVTYHAGIASQFRSAKHRRQWVASMEGSLPDALLDKPIGDIGADDLLRVMLPLAERVPETASRVRQRLDAVFDDAILRGLAERNPAAVIKRRMRGTKRAEHFRALDYAEVPALVAALRASPRISLPVRLCAVFAIATAARSGEARGALWGEIDRKARMWAVPADRMKRGDEHRVALSDFALAILDEAEALRDPKLEGKAPLFPSVRGCKLSDMTLTQALRRLPTGRTREDGEPETFADRTVMHAAARATFSTWANESAKARPDVVEACLAHREQDAVRRAYNRAQFERERRDLLAKWGRFISTAAATTAKVVPLHR